MVNSEPISFPIQIGLEVLQELEYFLQQSKALDPFMGGNYMIIPLQQCYFHCSHFRVNFEKYICLSWGQNSHSCQEKTLQLRHHQVHRYLQVGLSSLE